MSTLRIFNASSYGTAKQSIGMTMIGTGVSGCTTVTNSITEFVSNIALHVNTSPTKIVGMTITVGTKTYKFGITGATNLTTVFFKFEKTQPLIGVSGYFDSTSILGINFITYDTVRDC